MTLYIPPTPQPRVCACGCGETFIPPPSAPHKRFISAGHRMAWHQRQLAEARAIVAAQPAFGQEESPPIGQEDPPAAASQKDPTNAH